MMNPKKWNVLAAACLAIAGCCVTPARAAEPLPYLVLRSGTAPAPRRPAADHPSALAVPVTAPSYAYGWFGAQPKKHWSRHFGYYRSYTEWSLR